MVRDSGVKLVCPCTVDQDRGVERCFIYILRVGHPKRKPSKVKQGMKFDNCQSSENLGLMVGEPAFWHQSRRLEEASACYPHLRYLGL